MDDLDRDLCRFDENNTDCNLECGIPTVKGIDRHNARKKSTIFVKITKTASIACTIKIYPGR